MASISTGQTSTRQLLRLHLPENDFIPREVFENAQADSQRQTLICQLMVSSKTDKANQNETEQFQELQERLNQIRARHKEQRLCLFDTYKDLKTKARAIAIESARLSDSAASTARQSQCDNQNGGRMQDQCSANHHIPHGCFNQTLDNVYSGKITPKVTNRKLFNDHNNLQDHSGGVYRQQAQTPQVRTTVQKRELNDLCNLSDDENEFESSDEKTKLIRVKYDPLSISGHSQGPSSTKLRSRDQSYRRDEQEDSSLCIHGVIEQQPSPENHCTDNGVTSEDLQLGCKTVEDGHDEVNTFLETITNLEAFDLKLKSENHSHNQVLTSSNQNQQRGQPERYQNNHINRESLHSLSQSMSIENSAIMLKEQLARYKEAIGDTLEGTKQLSQIPSNKTNSGRNNNQILSTQQTPINMVLNSEKSGMVGTNGILGDTSLIQLRDAIDVIMGKLDEKIINNSSVLLPQKRSLLRCKERAISNDFVFSKARSNSSNVPKGWLLHQLGLKGNNTEDDHDCEQNTNNHDEQQSGHLSDATKVQDFKYKNQRPASVRIEEPLTTFNSCMVVENHQQQRKSKKKVVRHKVGKTNSPVQNLNFSFKVKHTEQKSMAMSSSSRKATENMGDQHDIDVEKREILSDEESGEVEHHMLRQVPQASTYIDVRGGTFRSARFPVQGSTTSESENILQTSFTEGDPMDRSVTGGGFENEIKTIRSLLGLLSQDVNSRVTSPKNFYGANEEEPMLSQVGGRDSSIGMNKTFEFHNAPPAMPTKSPMTNCLSAKVGRKAKTPKAGQTAFSNVKKSMVPSINAMTTNATTYGRSTTDREYLKPKHTTTATTTNEQKCKIF